MPQESYESIKYMRIWLEKVSCVMSKLKEEKVIFIFLDQVKLDVPTMGGQLMLVDMAGSENIEQVG